MEPPWDVGMEICSNVPGHMTKIVGPYMVKTFKNLLHNQEADDFETWYTIKQHRVLKYYQICSNDDTGLTDHFYNIVKFCFLMLLHG